MKKGFVLINVNPSSIEVHLLLLTVIYLSSEKMLTTICLCHRVYSVSIQQGLQNLQCYLSSAFVEIAAQ